MNVLESHKNPTVTALVFKKVYANKKGDLQATTQKAAASLFTTRLAL